MKKEYNVNIRFSIELVYALAALTQEEQINRELTQSAIDSHVAIFMSDSDNIDKLLELVFGKEIKLTRWVDRPVKEDGSSWENGMEGTKNDDTD